MMMLFWKNILPISLGTLLVYIVLYVM
jgi:hypothetical protein